MKKTVSLILFLVLIFAGTINAKAAEVLYAADKTSNLYTIDKTTGAATLVGPMGISHVTAMAYDLINDTLYAVKGPYNDPNQGCLYTVNTTTGAANQVGCDANMDHPTPGMDFHSNGTLYGIAPYNPRPMTLFSINTTNGLRTLIGASGIDWSEGNGFAIDQAGIGYLSNNSSPGNFYTINLSTGSETSVGAHTYTGFPPFTSNVKIGSMSFDENGILYGAVSDGVGSNANYLATINLTTAEVTFVANLPNDMDSIAFADITDIEPSQIPTLSEWGMIFMSLILAGSAFWMMRRRQLA